MNRVFAFKFFLTITALFPAWAIRGGIRRASPPPRDAKVAAALRREELRQRPQEGRN